MGRPANSPNKNKSFLMNRLQEMYGDQFHPIMKMAENCDTLQKIADAHREGAITEDKAEAGNVNLIDATSSAKEANLAWEKIAPYVEPKLTASTIDVTATELTHEQWVDSLNEQE